MGGETRLCGPCLSAREGGPGSALSSGTEGPVQCWPELPSTGMMTLLSFQVTPEGGTGWCSWSCHITGTHRVIFSRGAPRLSFVPLLSCSFPLSTQSHFQFLSILSSYLQPPLHLNWAPVPLPRVVVEFDLWAHCPGGLAIKQASSEALVNSHYAPGLGAGKTFPTSVHGWCLGFTIWEMKGLDS